MEAGHEKGIQDDVRNGADAGDAHAPEGLSGDTDEITEQLSQALEDAAQSYDPVVCDGVFIGSFCYTEDAEDRICKK